ncbi:MAG: S8 family serine peptidase [Pseudohongiellaceae bacterium]
MSARQLKSAVVTALLATAFQSPVQAQVVPDVVDNVQSVIDRQAERVQDRAAERVQNQVETVQEQVIERTQSQAERVQDQAAERVQSQVERVQEQAAGIVQGQVENIQDQAENRTRRQAERVADRLPDTGSLASRVLDSSAAGVEPGTGARRMAALPDRLPVSDQSGEPVFVEINIEPNIRVIEREWVMMLTTPQSERLSSEAPQLMRFLDQTSPFNALDSVVLKFTVPPDLDNEESILQMIPEEFRNLIDRNHVYSAQGKPAPQEGANDPQTEYDQGDSEPVERLPNYSSNALGLPMQPVCTDPVSVGIIDSAINVQHSAFTAARAVPLVRQDFIDVDVAKPLGHGTAIAGVLVGQGPELNPLLPAGKLYSASVIYSQDSYHQGATVMHLLQALDWVMAQNLTVINMSLTGPDNRLLAQAVSATIGKGKVIVAAAGNEGPHTPAAYPAAYEGVVAVTAVNPDQSIYRWANQGKHIDYAALGVSVPTARGDGGFGRESGTSMATPVVSAFLACALMESGGDLTRALKQLSVQTVDLGVPGHDPVFGHGLLHP